MASSQPASPDYYPPTNFHFAVHFGRSSSSKGEQVDLSNERVTFQSVSGLEVQVQTEVIKEGGENRFEHVVPTRTKYNDLVLKRGLVFENSAVLAWIKQGFENLIFNPVDIQIHMLNQAHEPLVVWDVFHAWPKAWKFDEFNAMQGKIFLETLELTYNTFRMRNA